MSTADAAIGQGWAVVPEDRTGWTAEAEAVAKMLADGVGAAGNDQCALQEAAAVGLLLRLGPGVFARPEARRAYWGGPEGWLRVDWHQLVRLEMLSPAERQTVVVAQELYDGLPAVGHLDAASRRAVVAAVAHALGADTVGGAS